IRDAINPDSISSINKFRAQMKSTERHRLAGNNCAAQTVDKCLRLFPVAADMPAAIASEQWQKLLQTICKRAAHIGLNLALAIRMGDENYERVGRAIESDRNARPLPAKQIIAE